MKVTFLGVGAAFSRKNANSNVLVESGPVKLLIDCGSTAPASLIEYGLTLKDVTHMLITHLHADHIGGLEEVAFMTKFVFKNFVKIVSTPSLLHNLWEYSLKGGLEYIEEVPADQTPQTLSHFFDLAEITSPQWFSIDENSPLQIKLIPSNHVKGMESYAIEVKENKPDGQQFFFSGDMKYDPKLIEDKLTDNLYIFHDCQLTDSGERNALGVHASYNQLRQLSESARNKTWLYHYGDDSLPDAQQDGFIGFLKHLQSFSL